MDGPNAWLLTDRILVYNEVLLGRGSLDRLPIGVFVCNLSGAPLYANRAMREWLSLEPNLPAWAAFWQRFTGSDAPPAERGRLEPGDPAPGSSSFFYVVDRVRNLEGQEVALAAYVAHDPAGTERASEHMLPAASDRTLALLLFRDGLLTAWSPLSPRWPPVDALAGQPESLVLEFLSREIESGRAPQFVPAREELSDGSVLMLAQAVEGHAGAGPVFGHDQLIAATAHEIRNPLATIRGFLQILPGAGPDERKRYAQIAMREVDRIIDVVNEFLQGGDLADVATSPVDLVAVARGAVQALREETLGTGLSLALEGDGREIWVTGRATRLAQVVTNLLHNAVESVAAPGGHVWLTLGTDDRWAVLVVEDDGPGVPDEWLEAIFEPTFSRRQGGHGLGLAIARWIVTSHGGRIVVGRSRAGGARFEVFLPWAARRDARPDPAASTPSS